jgi:uncharacterized membrane protein YebE (DUF533 family)
MEDLAMAGSSGGNVPENDRKGHARSTGDSMSRHDAAEKRALQRLDNEYQTLDSCEAILLATLQRLKSEEEALRAALEQAGETLDKKRARERKAQQDEAARRLESALLADDSSDDDDNDNDTEGRKAGNTAHASQKDQHDETMLREMILASSSDESVDEDELMKQMHE